MIQDIVARAFIVFLLALYSGIALVFVVAGIRKWIWCPLAGKIAAGCPDTSYSRIKRRQEQEGSPS